MAGDPCFLIRYGVMSYVGRFSAASVRDAGVERGRLVVIQTDRGLELGEVLSVLDGRPSPANGEDRVAGGAVDTQHVVRLAGPDDLVRSRDAAEKRASRFSLCERILREGNWPWPLVDVEPLLDGRATVLHYLGPHHIEVASLRARFRVECELDVILEPVGSDPGEEPADADEHDHDTGGGCGSCGCSDGGGCGSGSAPAAAGHHDEQAESVASGCSPRSHSGCSSCDISRLKAEWSRSKV
jgi:hypothetical protein